MNTMPKRSTAICPTVSPSCDLTLDDELVDDALDDGADRRGGRTTRHDGWTPERIRTFLITLAESGCVSDAAKAAGIGLKSAYNLRNRAEGRGFHYAWEAALRIARRRLADALMSRAVHGCVDQFRRNGEVVGERVRFDNRLAMALLTRLDNHVAASETECEAVDMAVEEFDQFVDVISSGGGAAGFVAERRSKRAGAVWVLDRLENYARYGVGLPHEIDISDLDPDRRDDWTEEQLARADRSGLLARLEEKAEDALWVDCEPDFQGVVHQEHPDGRTRWPKHGGGWRVFPAPR
jgi:hypothetical protein